VNLCLMTKEIDATNRRERGQGRGDDTHRPVLGPKMAEVGWNSTVVTWKLELEPGSEAH
jgi:hypothetical protein